MIQQPNYMNKSFLLNLQDKKKKIPFEYGTRWMSFYIYCRFPLGFVLGASNMINNYNIYSHLPSEFFIIKYAYYASFLQYAFAIFVYLQMKKRTMNGYHGNIVLLVCDVLLNTAINSYNKSQMYSQLIFWSVWAVINFVYFYKRKIVFEK